MLYLVGCLGIIICVFIALMYYNWQIGISILTILGALCLRAQKKKNITLERAQEKIRTWKSKEISQMAPNELDEKIASTISEICSSHDSNASEYIFDITNENIKMPYGRVQAILSNFATSLETTEVYYASFIPSVATYDLLEFGTVITRDGIYITKQEYYKGESKIKKICIPFKGLYSIDYNKDKYIAEFVVKDSDELLFYTQPCITSSIPVARLVNICQFIINSNISRILLFRGFSKKVNYLYPE